MIPLGTCGDSTLIYLSAVHDVLKGEEVRFDVGDYRCGRTIKSPLRAIATTIVYKNHHGWFKRIMNL